MRASSKHVAALVVVGVALVALGALAWTRSRRPRVTSLERTVHDGTRAVLAGLAPREPGRPGPVAWNGRLSPIACQCPHGDEVLTIRKPEGWTARYQEPGLLTLEADTPGSDGAVPHVHVVSAPALPVPREEQLSAIEDAVASAAGACEWRRDAEPRVVPDDVELVSTLSLPGRPAVKVAWSVFFRPKRTYVLAAAADERDFGALSTIFLACARSVRAESPISLPR